MVVGISATHKVLDASSLITFLTDWSSLARYKDPNFVLTPLAKLLPPSPTNELPVPSPNTTAAGISREACVTNVYVFSPCGIPDLKRKVASESNIPKPSRVEVVTSVLWKFLAANSKKSSFSIEEGEESEKDVANMVVALRKGLLEFDNHYVKRLKGDKAIGTALELIRDAMSLLNRKDEGDLYHFSSWCGYSFYDVDFGWGTPIVFSSIESKFKNMIFLTDTKDGGVEAWVTLSEEDMKMFEKNSSELLTYATLKASLPN
ncbi:hypothetical protein HAX54_025647 [Datura stramonium]|uniref:Uncharacterized protein n=1 Tax=Datura stramonium TaxID=4076 RepID=A0ABS8V1G1_DATST|nr:hypothetical protein [Datura stramonium]